MESTPPSSALGSPGEPRMRKKKVKRYHAKHVGGEEDGEDILKFIERNTDEPEVKKKVKKEAGVGMKVTRYKAFNIPPLIALEKEMQTDETIDSYGTSYYEYDTVSGSSGTRGSRTERMGRKEGNQPSTLNPKNIPDLTVSDDRTGSGEFKGGKGERSGVFPPPTVSQSKMDPTALEALLSSTTFVSSLEAASRLVSRTLYAESLMPPREVVSKKEEVVLTKAPNAPHDQRQMDEISLRLMQSLKSPLANEEMRCSCIGVPGFTNGLSACGFEQASEANPLIGVGQACVCVFSESLQDQPEYVLRLPPVIGFRQSSKTESPQISLKPLIRSLCAVPVPGNSGGGGGGFVGGGNGMSTGQLGAFYILAGLANGRLVIWDLVSQRDAKTTAQPHFGITPRLMSPTRVLDYGKATNQLNGTVANAMEAIDKFNDSAMTTPLLNLCYVGTSSSYVYGFAGTVSGISGVLAKCGSNEALKDARELSTQHSVICLYESCAVALWGLENMLPSGANSLNQSPQQSQQQQQQQDQQLRLFLDTPAMTAMKSSTALKWMVYSDALNRNSGIGFQQDVSASSACVVQDCREEKGTGICSFYAADVCFGLANGCIYFPLHLIIQDMLSDPTDRKTTRSFNPVRQRTSETRVLSSTVCDILQIPMWKVVGPDSEMAKAHLFVAVAIGGEVIIFRSPEVPTAAANSTSAAGGSITSPSTGGPNSTVTSASDSTDPGAQGRQIVGLVTHNLVLKRYHADFPLSSATIAAMPKDKGYGSLLLCVQGSKSVGVCTLDVDEIIHAYQRSIGMTGGYGGSAGVGGGSSGGGSVTSIRGKVQRNLPIPKLVCRSGFSGCRHGVQFCSCSLTGGSTIGILASGSRGDVGVVGVN